MDTSASGAAVTWSVSGNESTSTTIDQNGKLTVGDDEKATTLIVTATTVKHGAQGTKRVTVTTPKYSIIVSATEGGTASSAVTYEQGATATVTAEPDAGYIFVNWTENGKVVSTDASYSFAVTGNRTLVANFEEVAVAQYTVTFDTAGGTPTAIDSQSISAGGTATQPADPSRDGYHFGGWYAVDASGQEAASAFDFSTQIQENVDLKAKWIKKYKITLDPGNHATLEDAYKVLYTQIDGTLAGPLPIPDANNDGAGSFIAWSTVEGSLSDATRVTANDTVFTSDTTIYAYWQKANKKYDAEAINGKLFNTENSGKYSHDALIEITADKAPAGMVFDKWVVDQGNIQLDNPYAETTRFVMPAEKVIVRATYKGAVSVTVQKVWDDNNDAAGKRPQSVTVVLMADGEEYGERVELNDENNWTCTWDTLSPDAEYTVKEVEVPDGYTMTVSGDAENGFTITNSYEEPEPEPETVTVSGTKSWVGDEESDRPDSIIVNLLANDEVIDEAEVTAATQWTYSFKNLPKNDAAGAEIEYTVEEEPVEGYTATYVGYNIVNTKNTPPVQEKCTVTYLPNGGTGTMEPDTVKSGDEYTLRANGFTAPNGKVFKCWKVEIQDARTRQTSAKEYKPGEKITITGNVTATAVWETKTVNGLDYVPKTGDTSGVMLWTALLLMSAVALTGYELRRKRSVR